MATLNTAVQAMVDNLHNKMTSNEPLNGEEQTLMASAIDKLSGNTTWEQALIAVAEEHLNAATQTLNQTMATTTQTLSDSLATATGALTNAEGDINQARQTIETQNANLALIPQLGSDVQSALDGFGLTNSTQLRSNLAGMARPVFGVNKIETPANSGINQRGTAVFAVYDASGESWLVRPAFSNTNNTTEVGRLEYLKLLADGSNKSVIKSHFLYTNTFYAAPSTNIFYYGASAILPLAAKSDANDIAYDIVYSGQDSTTTSDNNYAGVYCRTAGYSTTSKPKLNINATDQWGISTTTNHTYNDVGVLYDNIKHCLVMVDSSTSLLVEKYRDGNVTTTVSIPDAATLQNYVDAGDFTVVKFIVHQLSWPSCFRKFNNAQTNSSVSSSVDCYGFYGKLGSLTRLGGLQHCAHYRFSAAKKLEPVNYFFASSVNPVTTNVPATGEVTVSITDMIGNTLGIYQHKSKVDTLNYPPGHMANAIVCMNPYSHVGILNEHTAYNGTTAYYGIGRTCRAF